MILCDNHICDDREPCVPIVTHKNSYFYTEDVDDDGLNDDVLMKPLSRVNFKHFRDKIGVVRKDLPRKGE